MSVRDHRIGMLALHGLYGAYNGWIHSTGAPWSRGVDLIYLVAMTVWPYLWLRADAAERGVTRGLTVSGAIIYLPMIAAPLYLWRRDGAAGRWRNLGRFALYVLALATAYLLAGAPLAYLRGGM